MTTDVVLTDDYDIQIDENGDILTEEFYDTAILYSLFGERRASPDEVVEPQLRRGWIGNTDDFENGSKIWLFTQSRLTRNILNRVADEATKSLQWLVDDGLAVSIDNVKVRVENDGVFLDLTVKRSANTIQNKSYNIWENTALAS